MKPAAEDLVGTDGVVLAWAARAGGPAATTNASALARVGVGAAPGICARTAGDGGKRHGGGW